MAQDFGLMIQSMDLTTLVVWSVAGLSLLIQIYLFLTWPRTTVSQRKEVSTNPDGLNFNRQTKVSDNWEAPSDEALDGILNATFSSPDSTGPRRRKKSVAAPITLEQRIIRAGIYRKGGMRSFHITRILLTLAGLFSGCLIIPFTPLPWIFAAYIGLFGALTGYIAPSFWLDKRLAKRQTTMRRALPDALDLITVCLQGGLSLPASLSRVARELGPAHPMLATELSIAEREIQMGRTTGGAMLQFANRFNLEELRSLSSVIGQTEKFGGSVAGALKTYAESLRERRKQHAEEMAQKAAVKLLFPTLFCIFPGIFVVILGPTAVRMMQVMQGVTF